MGMVTSILHSCTHWYDWLRYFVIGLGFIIDGIVIAVIIEAKRFRPPPRYVYLMGVSYILTEVAVQIYIYEHIGEPFGYKFVFVAVANFLTLYAFILLWNYYRPSVRKKRHDRNQEEALERLRREYGFGE